ncbi:isopentenyl-diphosphate Delta-isomerase [Candidatus Woesearchaeota archaeon]|nr:isopentenyl-diphosphate Delta-isomerase [Candidatus Woesearchaeota archaeon]
MEEVILVDENDNQIGTEEKLQAHKDGKLHRCFSIFVFNSKGELMIQQRALDKYHCGGIWANICCSHPRPKEDLKDAVHRRIMEEMGFDCELKEIFTFTYKAEFDNGLTEHEFDHVFFGICDKEPEPNPKEVADYRWISVADLQKEFVEKPEIYAPWLKIALKILLVKHPDLIP